MKVYQMSGHGDPPPKPNKQPAEPTQKPADADDKTEA